MGNPVTAVTQLLQDETLWGVDLSQLNNLTTTVERLIKRIEATDVRQVISEMKGTMTNA